MNKEIKNIYCTRVSYIRVSSMAIIVLKQPNINQVNVLDAKKERIKKWNSNLLTKSSMFEPGLEEIIKRCKKIILNFSNLMRSYSWLFEVRSIANYENVEKTDLNFWGIGNGA